MLAEELLEIVGADRRNGHNLIVEYADGTTGQRVKRIFNLAWRANAIAVSLESGRQPLQAQLSTAGN